MSVFGVYGAGGCGRGILPLVRTQLSSNDEVVFVDDRLDAQCLNGGRVLSFERFVNSTEDRAICLAVADGAARRALDLRCREAGVSFFSVRAIDSIEMDDVSIGEGALLSPFTTLTSNIRIGRHFHLNLYSYVEHDCVIGDFVTFAPAVRCNGGVVIGDGAYIGANAVIRQGTVIGARATVGMGAVVTKDVPPGETWVGNPARPITN